MPLMIEIAFKKSCVNLIFSLILILTRLPSTRNSRSINDGPTFNFSVFNLIIFIQLKSEIERVKLNFEFVMYSSKFLNLLAIILIP